MKLLISAIIATAILIVAPVVCAADYLDKYPVWPDRYGSHVMRPYAYQHAPMRVVPIPQIVQPYREIVRNRPVLNYQYGQPLRNVLRGVGRIGVGVGRVGVGAVVITARGVRNLGLRTHNARARIHNYNQHVYRCNQCGRVHYH